MKYSVIIPFYNSEKTLWRCLDSLRAADCPDAEILLVDDGSSDGGADICRRFDDPRMILLQQSHSGVSTARNLGLAHARGEFVLFVDSDDFVEPDYFARLDRLDPEGRYDYLLFSYFRFDGIRRRAVLLPNFSSETPDEYGPMLAAAYRRKWINVPWNKRYRRSILQTMELRFHPELPISEDVLFNLQYLLHCRSLRICGEPLYTVSLENPNSLTRRPRTDRQACLELLDRESVAAISAAPISAQLRSLLMQSRNFLLLSNIYSSAKLLHLAHRPLPVRWRLLWRQCRDFRALRLSLPGDLRSRLLTLPVHLRFVPAIDLLGRLLAAWSPFPKQAETKDLTYDMR